MCRIGDLEDRRAIELHLPGDRIHQRLAVAKTFVVPDVDPVAVRGIRLRGDLQGRPALQIVVSDKPDILGVVGHRIWSWGAGAGAGREKPEARSQKPEEEDAYPLLASGSWLPAPYF